MQECKSHPLIAILFSVSLGIPSLSGCAATPKNSTPPSLEETNITAQPQTASRYTRLFYKALVGELEYVSDNMDDAYFMMLNAARQSNDDLLYERAIQIALRANADDAALKTAREWQKTNPQARNAYRYELELLLKLKQYNKIESPIRKSIELTPAEERPPFIIALGKYLAPHAAAIDGLYESILSPWIQGSNKEEAICALLSINLVKLAADKPQEALALIEKAREIDPKSGEPIMAAVNLMDQGIQQAQKIVLSYLESPDADPQARLFYTQYLLRENQINAAIQQLTLASQHPDAPPITWFILGSLQLDTQQTLQGKNNLEIYLNKTKNDITQETRSNQERAYLSLAQVEVDTDQLDKAAHWLNQVSDPEVWIPAQKAYISMLINAGKYNQASNEIARLPNQTEKEKNEKALFQSNVLIRQGLYQQAYTFLDKANKQSITQDEDLLYQQSYVAEKLKRFDQMEALLYKIIEINPESADAYNAIGYSLADRNIRLNDARRLLTKALELKPESPMIEDSLGWLEFRQGNHEEALKLIKKAYLQLPDSEIASHLGEVLWQQGLKDDALSVFKLAQSNAPENTILQKTLARLRISQKTLDNFTIPPELLRQFQSAQHSSSRGLNMENQLKRLIQEGKWQQVYDLLAPLLEQSPSLELMQLQAYAADKTGRLPEAEALLRKIMTNHPDNAMAYNDLGYILASHNIRLDEAKSLIETAYKLQPNSAAILDSMGWIAFKEGDYQEAIKYLQQAYDMDPSIAEIGIHLGEALWQANRKGEALLIWKEVNKKHPDNQDLQTTLERLGAQIP